MIAALLIYGLAHVQMIAMPSVVNGIATVCIAEKLHDKLED
jgi:hypothetical protein